MSNPIKGSFLICMLCLLTGCWDRVEIEERGFVVGAAIDLGEESEDPQIEGRSENYKLTYQIVVPGNLSGKGIGGTQGGSEEESSKPFLNLTEEAKTIFQLSREMSNKTSRSPYLEHIKLIVLSEELAKKGYISEAIDVFVRDHEMRRAAKVMIAEGEAKEIFEINPQYEKIPVIFIESVSENTKKTGIFVPPTNVSDVHSYLLKGTSFIIPRIVAKGENMEVTGAAIFNSKAHKLIGTLNNEETKALNLITGELESAVLEFPYQGQIIAFEIKSAKSKIIADTADMNRIKFTVDIEVEGNVGESSGNIELLKLSALAKIEEKVEEDVESLLRNVIEKVHSEYKVDILGFGANLNQNHYRKWKLVKDEWDTGENYFQKSLIDVQVKANVRQIGASIEATK